MSEPLEELLKTEELVNIPNQLVSRVTIVTGGEVKLHRHADTHECYQVLSGSGKLIIEVEGVLVERIIKPNDFISIPPNTPHKIWNDDGQEIFPLVFLSIKNSNIKDMIPLE